MNSQHTKPESKQESDLVQLQKTLYTSRNPTRKWLHSSRYKWVCDAVHRYAVFGGAALEVGPGCGVYLPTLSSHFTNVTAVDIEQDYLDGLETLLVGHGNITTKIDDITDSLFEDSCFDLVLCTEVLEHIDGSAAAVAELHRILKPCGLLVLSTPQPFSPLELAAKVAFIPGIAQVVRLVYREPLLPLGHINLLSGRTLQNQLTCIGFEIIERHTSGLYIPLFSEFCGEWAVNVQKRVEKKIRGTCLEFLLWTQYYVARAIK